MVQFCMVRFECALAGGSLYAAGKKGHEDDGGYNSIFCMTMPSSIAPVMGHSGCCRLRMMRNL